MPTYQGVIPKKERYRVFFQRLIDTLREEYEFTSARVAQPENWHQFASGFGGIRYDVRFTREGYARVMLHIYGRSPAWQRQVFYPLKKINATIESELQLQGLLSWNRERGRKGFTITVSRQGSIDDDQETLEEIQDWMVDRLLKFKEVFDPYLDELTR